MHFVTEFSGFATLEIFSRDEIFLELNVKIYEYALTLLITHCVGMGLSFLDKFSVWTMCKTKTRASLHQKDGQKESNLRDYATWTRFELARPKPWDIWSLFVEEDSSLTY